MAWEPKDKEAFRKHYLAEGETGDQLAERFGVGRACIYGYVAREVRAGNVPTWYDRPSAQKGLEAPKEINTERKTRAWVPPDIEKFNALYLGGMSAPKIAIAFEVGVDLVRGHLRRAIARKELPAFGEFTPGGPQTSEHADALLDAKVLARLKKHSVNTSVVALADILDVSPRRIEDAIERLRAANYIVHVEGGMARVATPISGNRSEMLLPYQNGNWVRFGLVSDAHLGSKYEQLDKLNIFYDLLAEKGITDVFDTGNWIEGEARFNKNDIHTAGLDNQVKYWATHWPQREGMNTHFIAGDDHEGWYVQATGIDIGKHAEHVARELGRTDLHYLGYMEHDVIFPAAEGQTSLRLQHPGGGSSYATSYAPQKVVETLSGGEKPSILCLGHWHKAGYFFIRNIHTVLSGCFQAQSPFMRKKRLAAHVGGWVIEFLQAPNGEVLEFRPTFIPFYEVSAYADEQWTYKM